MIRSGILTALFAFILSVSVRAQDAGMPLPALPVIPAKTFSITDYGAVGDGKTVNTAAIQKAIDAVSQAGGGRLVVPAGQFLTGPLVLTSNLNLQLARGAVLLMSADMAAYPVGANGYQGCLTAANAHDIEISGEGTINGQGVAWWKAARANNALPNRPFLVQFSLCTRVEVTGIKLMNSPMFHLVPSLCHDVTIRDITITAPSNSHNTDGIDPSGSNYLIENCTIDVGDDNIAIKPGHGEKSQNYTITHCTFLHGHGMSIGSGTRHGGGAAYGLENMTVSQCTFNGTKIGIRIKATRGRGFLAQNITYDHLTMTHVGNPIEIVAYYPMLPKTPTEDPAQTVTPMTPTFTGITLSNVTVTGSLNAGIIWGLPEMPVSGLTFTNVHIVAATGMTICHARDVRFSGSDITVQSGEKLILADAKSSGVK